VKKIRWQILYFGMLAIVWLATSCKPALTEKTADKLIPNGMAESKIYEMLGTNAAVSNGQHGEKTLIYFFKFFPPPPKINPKINGIEIVISNGVVIREFPSQ
jgi:hypothetical protein